MKFLYAIVAVVLAAAPASAAGHVYRLLAVADGTNQIGFMDVSTLQKTNGGGTYTSLWVEPEVHVIQGYNISYALRSYKVDCAAHTSQMVHVSVFTDKDEMIFDQDMADRKPDAVTPDSAGQQFLSTVCGGPLTIPNPPEYGSIGEAVAAGRQFLKQVLANKKT